MKPPAFIKIARSARSRTTKRSPSRIDSPNVEMRGKSRGRSFQTNMAINIPTNRGPVLVKLGQFHQGADPAAAAADAVFTNHERFLDSNRNGALVLILDAFDEMGKASRSQSLNESFDALTGLSVRLRVSLSASDLRKSAD